MQIEQITIDGFGAVCQQQIGELAPGVNVLWGANGSGKTTLLHFLRSVFSGYEPARRRRLLPPAQAGQQGGSIRVRAPHGRFEVIRRGRQNGSDTLAIQLLEGEQAEISRFRSRFEDHGRQAAQDLFSLSAVEGSGFDGLVVLAAQHGIDLTPRKSAISDFGDRLRRLESERADLFHREPARDAIHQLETQRDSLAERLRQSQKTDASRLSKWSEDRRQLRAEIARLQQEAAWLKDELQASQSDLTEVQTRLWGFEQRILPRIEKVASLARPTLPSASAEVREIDDAIAHIQQVLRDLANRRRTISITASEQAGCEIPDPAAALLRQRNHVSQLDGHLGRFAEALDRLTASPRECQCGNLRGHLRNLAAAQQRELSLLCQELSRQQTAYEQHLLSTQRDDVDRCELELTRQLQRLRQRRDEIQHNLAEQNLAAYVSPTEDETRHCVCENHHEMAAIAAGEPQSGTTQSIIVRQSVEMVSSAREGDAELEAICLTRKTQLWQQSQQVNRRLRSATAQLDDVQSQADQFVADRTLPELHFEYQLVEQQLADQREQWDSLRLLQNVLCRTRDQLNLEQPSSVLEEASRQLNQQTQGRYAAFQFHGSSARLQVVNREGHGYFEEQLSRGTLEQASLCLRLAICHELQRQTVNWPLVLDDVLVDCDGQRLHEAAQSLVEYGQHGQVLFLTCQEHVAEALVAQGAQRLNLWETQGRQAPDARPPLRVAESPVVEQPESVAETSEPALVPPRADVLSRLQPDVPYWLEPGSPLELVPSLSVQTARRLGALGLRVVADLIELDPEAFDIPWEALQLSPRSLRALRSEALLLCCVPDLTGRDAQMLVMLGIQDPLELANSDLAEMLRRVRRLQEQGQSEFTLAWRAAAHDWPTRESLGRWIRRARRARTLHRNASTSRRRLGSRRSTSFSASDMPVYEDASLATAPVFETTRTSSHATATLKAPRFYLRMDSPIVDAPSIGPKTARRLATLGIVHVGNLLQRDAVEIAAKLRRRDVTTEVVVAWQQQSLLMCRIPELRGHDAQILVACDIVDPETIAYMSPDELLSIVEPLALSTTGQRILRSCKVPDLEEVTGWVHAAREMQSRRAA